MATRLERYLTEGSKRGWDMDRWKDSLKDTEACRAEADKKVDPIDRMTTFVDCRHGKKLPVKGR